MVAKTRLNITFIRKLYGLSSLATSIPDARNEQYQNCHFLFLRLISSGDVSVGTVARLRATQPRDSISIHDRGDKCSIHQNIQTGSGDHPASYSTVTGYSFRSNRATGSVKLTVHLHLPPGLKMSDAIPPLLHVPSWCIQRQLHI